MPSPVSTARHPVRRSTTTGSWLPGTIVTVTTVAGKRVQRGDALATLEAMKMETTVRAEIDGTVSEVVMRPGLQVDAKDLLAVIG